MLEALEARGHAKKDITARIHQHAGISNDDAMRVLERILELLKASLQAGESIAIAGFGKFTVRQKHARPVRNIKTGEALTISARRVVTFHASPLFRREINSPSAAEREAVEIATR